MSSNCLQVVGINTSKPISASTKHALVTGASSGIGQFLAMELASRGYSIVAVSNQEEDLLRVKAELEESYGINVHVLYINLAQINAAKEVYRFCSQNKLEVEVLINNAGVLVKSEVTNTAYDKAKDILQLHMTTPALLCRLFGQDMEKRKSGFILNVSSISAVMPYPTISLYGPTKSFLRNFTRALRTELRPHDVVVTCLIPGATDTPLNKDLNFNTPHAFRLGLVKKPEAVARNGIKALFQGKAECIPGLFNKMIVWFVPWIPHFIIAWLYARRNRE